MRVYRRVGEKLSQAGLPGVSDDTILRAAARCRWANTAFAVFATFAECRIDLRLLPIGHRPEKRGVVVVPVSGQRMARSNENFGTRVASSSSAAGIEPCRVFGECYGPAGTKAYEELKSGRLHGRKIAGVPSSPRRVPKNGCGIFRCRPRSEARSERACSGVRHGAWLRDGSDG